MHHRSVTEHPFLSWQKSIRSIGLIIIIIKWSSGFVWLRIRFGFRFIIRVILIHILHHHFRSVLLTNSFFRPIWLTLP